MKKITNISQYIKNRIKVDERDCWIWQNSKTKYGYGACRVGNKPYKTHRLSYETFIGVIPNDFIVYQSCNKKDCCNPLHLYTSPRKIRSPAVKKKRVYLIIKPKYKKYYSAYRSQKCNAKIRNIEFNLTFYEWIDWWERSGNIDNRGCKKGQYVMARFNDCGSYNLDNIKCITTSDNCKDRIGKKNNKSEKQKIKEQKRG